MSQLSEINPNPQEDGQVNANTSVFEPADLENLFKKYPDLQAQLRQIYKSTRDPLEGRAGLHQDGNGRDVSRRPWKPEKAFENGLTTLNRLAENGSVSSEGIAAFMKLLADRSTA